MPAMMGPVPNFPVVNPDGTPTRYFYAWMLKARQATTSIDDLVLLQATEADGAAAADGAIAHAAGDIQLSADTSAMPPEEEFPALDVPPAQDPENAALADLTAVTAGAVPEDYGDIALLFADRAPVAPPAAPLRDVLANLPAGLNAGDAGLRFFATDYQHWYRWDGAAWHFDDGEIGSGYIEWFTVPPRSGKWQLCDGTTGVRESLANGTDALVAFSGLAAGTMPDLVTTGTYLRGAAACTGTVVAVTAPTIGGHADTGNAVIPPVLSGSGFAQITGSTGNDSGAGQVVQSGAGATVAAHTHTHPTAGTVTDTGHQHVVSVTDTGHTHTLSPANAPIAPGESRHMDAMPYYRL